MTKSCYFCIHCCDNKLECLNHSRSHFIPNADWLEYESLKKENEELKAKNKEAFAYLDIALNAGVDDLDPALKAENEELKKENEKLKDILKDENIVVDVLGVNTLVTNPFRNGQE